MRKKVLVIMNSIETIDISKDSTYQLMVAAQKMGHDLYYVMPGSLSISSSSAKGHIGNIKLYENKEDFYEISNISESIIKKFNYVLMRLDPPVDDNYMYITYILDIIQKNNIKVINPGNSLRNNNEKLITLNFPKHIPETIVTCSTKELKNFLLKYKKIILKPLNLMGGRSIYLLDENDKNANVIFEDMTKLDSKYIMAQEYLPESEKGDKRIIIINGKVFKEAVIRVPSSDDHRGNIASGGTIRKYILNKKEISICEEVALYLKKEGIIFAGIDMIGEKITEVNITSPTCIAEINKFHNLNLGEIFWKEVL